MRRSLLLLSWAFALALASHAKASQIQTKLPDYRAEVHVNDRGRGVLYTTKVAVSKYGMRSETKVPRSGRIITIANYKLKTCTTYLVGKKAYYIEALDPKAPDCDLDLEHLFGEYTDILNSYGYHVLGATHPCRGYKHRLLGEDTVDDRHVEKWECLDPGNHATFFQWFDPVLGRVIKHQDQLITKVYSNIVIKPLSRSLFKPLHGYRQYSQNAFFDLLRIPAFSTTGKRPADMNKLLPNDRLQICIISCQADQDKCNAASRASKSNRCDKEFDQCAAKCEKKYPPQ